jgi:ABC-type uncharacterized transport system auxiliary subunit
VLGSLFALLAGCADLSQLLPTRERPVIHDLGPVPVAESVQSPAPGIVVQMDSSPWLNNTNVQFRLAYENQNRLNFYSTARWVGPPTEMLRERLAWMMAAHGQQLVAFSNKGMVYRLNLSLDVFEQEFSAPGKSVAKVQMRGVLIDATSRKIISQRLVSVAVNAEPSINGAVSGLAAAANGAVKETLDWLAAIPESQITAASGRR